MKSQNIDLKTKMDLTRQKLMKSYQSIEKRKHTTILLSELKDVPKITEVSILFNVYNYINDIFLLHNINILSLFVAFNLG